MDKLDLQLWLVAKCELGGVSYCRRMDTDARFNYVAIQEHIIPQSFVLFHY